MPLTARGVGEGVGWVAVGILEGGFGVNGTRKNRKCKDNFFTMSTTS